MVNVPIENRYPLDSSLVTSMQSSKHNVGKDAEAEPTVAFGVMSRWAYQRIGVIDLAALIILGYELKDALRTVEFETAKGELLAYVFKVKELTALGITRRNVEVCSYDFFNNNVFSDMHGVLGLDFFLDCKLCIDMVEREITVQQKVRK